MNLRRGSVISLSVLCLTSCGVVPTQFVPNGYKYHDDTPLSTPAPTRPWMHEADRPNLDNMSENTAAWQGAIYELITPLPGMLPPATTRLALVTKTSASTADNSFNHYLREALLSYGYRIDEAPMPSNTTLVYNAAPLSNEATLKKVQAKYGKEFVTKEKAKDRYYLTLGVQGANGKMLNEQSSIAILPHEKNEYWRVPGLSYAPPQGPNAPKKPVYLTRE